MDPPSGRYHAPMPLLLALAALLLLTTFAPTDLYREPPIPARPTVRFQPVPLDASSRARRRLGRLVYLGGWRIDSNDPRFGGISAMHVNRNEVLAVSDSGWLIRFSRPDRPWHHIEINEIPEGPGKRILKFNRDAESMLTHGRHVWVGFEYRKAVWRYRRASWRSDSHAEPPAMQDWPANSGAEAMLRLADGRFLVFAEGAPGPGDSTELLLFEGDPAREGMPVTRLGYRAPEGYRITDAAPLRNGRFLFLNRRFTLLGGFTARLTLGSRFDLHAGAIVTGAEIARFEDPVINDNFEALSVTREGGRTIVWIASDDNYSALQRTLLLKFALEEPKP